MKSRYQLIIEYWIDCRMRKLCNGITGITTGLENYFNIFTVKLDSMTNRKINENKISIREHF